MMPDLVSTLMQFWLGMVAHLWQSTLVLCVISVMALGMKRAPSRFVRMIWISGLIKLFLPLAFGGAVLQVIGNQVLHQVRPEEALVTVPTLRAVVAVLDAPREILLWQWMQWAVSPASVVVATAIWALCVLFLLGRLVRDVERSRAHTVVSRQQMEPSVMRKLDYVLNRLGIAHVDVDVCSQLTMPGVVGIMRPRILIPHGLLRALTQSELETILVHERAHQRRYDPLWALLQRICSAFLFFYPLLPFLLRRLSESSEFACDEEVTISGLSSRTYASALTRSLQLGLQPLRFSSAVIRGHQSLVNRRLERLTLPRRFKMSGWCRFCIVLVVFLVTTASFLPLSLRADERMDRDTTSSESSEKLPAIDEEVEYDTPPKVSKFEPPIYPEEAKKSGLTGTVVVKLLIDTMGNVRDARIVEGPEVFYESVEGAVYNAKFTPARRDDKAVALWVALPIKFALDDK